MTLRHASYHFDLMVEQQKLARGQPLPCCFRHLSDLHALGLPCAGRHRAQHRDPPAHARLPGGLHAGPQRQALPTPPPL